MALAVLVVFRLSAVREVLSFRSVLVASRHCPL